MSFALPLVLILIAPLAALAYLLASGRVATAGRLPGAWAGLVAPSLRRYVAARAATARNCAPFLALALAALIVLALARPGAHTGGEIDLTGIAGRVIVMDAGGTNFRVATVCFKDNGHVDISNFQVFPMPGIKAEASKKEFFGTMAGYAKDVLGQSDSVGFCFSYPIEICSENRFAVIRADF